MSAPALGQVVFVAQPQPATGFDVGIVTANLGAGAHVASAYEVSVLLFTTDPASGVIKPIVVEAEGLCRSNHGSQPGAWQHDLAAERERRLTLGGSVNVSSTSSCVTPFWSSPKVWPFMVLPRREAATCVPVLTKATPAGWSAGGGVAVSCGKHVLARPLPPRQGLSEDVLLGSCQMATPRVL